MRSLIAFLKLLVVIFTITALSLPAAVLIHEGTHLILYHLEGIPVTSFHVLDAESLQNGYYGFVTTTHASRYGSLIQEGIANLFSYLFVTAMLLFCFLKPLRRFTIHQLDEMGVKRNSAPFSIHGT